MRRALHEPRRHDRDVADPSLVDLGLGDPRDLGVGVDQLDLVVGLGADQARDDLPSVGASEDGLIARGDPVSRVRGRSGRSRPCRTSGPGRSGRGRSSAVPRPPAAWHFTQPIPLASKKIASPPSRVALVLEREGRGALGSTGRARRRGDGVEGSETWTPNDQAPIPCRDLHQEAVLALLERDADEVGVGGVGAAGEVAVLRTTSLVQGDGDRPARPDEQQGGAVAVGVDLGEAEGAEVGRAVGVVAEPAAVARAGLEVVEDDAAGRRVGLGGGPRRSAAPRRPSGRGRSRSTARRRRPGAVVRANGPMTFQSATGWNRVSDPLDRPGPAPPSNLPARGRRFQSAPHRVADRQQGRLAGRGGASGLRSLEGGEVDGQGAGVGQRGEGQRRLGPVASSSASVQEPGDRLARSGARDGRDGGLADLGGGVVEPAERPSASTLGGRRPSCRRAPATRRRRTAGSGRRGSRRGRSAGGPPRGRAAARPGRPASAGAFGSKTTASRAFRPAGRGIWPGRPAPRRGPRSASCRPAASAASAGDRRGIVQSTRGRGRSPRGSRGPSRAEPRPAGPRRPGLPTASRPAIACERGPRRRRPRSPCQADRGRAPSPCVPSLGLARELARPAGSCRTSCPTRSGYLR